MSDAALTQIQFMRTDSPTLKLYKQMTALCPNLKCLCLDPGHLAILLSMSTPTGEKGLQGPSACGLCFVNLQRLNQKRMQLRGVLSSTAGTSKEVRKVLWSACTPEWLCLMNNLRARHSMDASARALLPAGTTSNEALHAEINAWSRGKSKACARALLSSSHTCCNWQSCFRTMQLSAICRYAMYSSVSG